MTRRLTLLTVAVLAIAETYRRGYAAPLIFGLRLWVNVRPDSFYEPEIVA